MLVAVALLALQALPVACRPAPGADGAAAHCSIDAGPCRVVGPQGLRVSFDLQPKPVRTMTDLTVVVEARRGEQPIEDESLTVDVRMPDMVMGVNRVTLARRGAGRYEGRLTLVRCPSGRRTWEATLVSPSIPGARVAFEVDRP